MSRQPWIPLAVAAIALAGAFAMVAWPAAGGPLGVDALAELARVAVENP